METRLTQSVCVGGGGVGGGWAVNQRGEMEMLVTGAGSERGGEVRGG